MIINRQAASPQLKDIFVAVVINTTWFIWISRNNARFQKVPFSKAHILCEIVVDVSLSGNLPKGFMHNTMFGFFVFQVFRVSGHPPRAPRILQVSWSPPLPGWYKCNIDGAARGMPRLVAYGGNFRDFRGSFMGSFSLHIEVSLS